MRAFWAALAGPVLHLRRLRRESVAVALLVILLGATALVFSAAPRLANRAWQAGLHYELQTASPSQRGIEVVRTTGVRVGANPDASLLDAASSFASDQVPASVNRLITQTDVVVTSLLFTVTTVPTPDQPAVAKQQTFRLRAQTDLAAHVTITAGRLPRETTDGIYEIAISPATAQAMQLKVGDQIGLRADNRDGFIYGLNPTTTYSIIAEIVGLVQARDRTDPYWWGDFSVDDPDIDLQGAGRINGVALISSGALHTLGQDEPTYGFQERWRYQVDPTGVSLADLPQVEADLNRLILRFRGSALQLSLRTGLPALLSQFSARQVPAAAVLLVAGIGVLGVALLAIAVVARLVAARRREGVLLWRTRGAGRRQLIGTLVFEALVIALPSAAVGELVAARIWPGLGADAARGVALIVALAAAVLLTVIGALLVLGPLQAARETAPEQEPSRRRLVAEATVVLLAAAGLYLLRLRGIGAGTSTTSGIGAIPTGGADPFLAAVPVLLGVATGLIVIRAFPYPVRLLGWLAARRRDMVIPLALRQVGRAPSAYTLTLLVVLLAMGVATFSSVITTTIDRGQQIAAWLSTGADFQVQGTAGVTIPDNVSFDELTGVTASARAYVGTQLPTTTTRGFGGYATLEAIQAAAYATVAAGTPADPHLPPSLLASPPASAIGTTSAPIPAIVSPQKPGGGSFVPGDEFDMAVGADSATFTVVEVRDSFPALTSGANFVIAPLAWLRAAMPQASLQATVVYVRAPGVAPATLQSEAQHRWPPALVTSRQSAYDALHLSPIVQAVVNGFLLGLIVAAAYAVMAVVIALALTAARRSRDLAYLRTLGMSARQVLAALAVEHAPPLIVAVLAGLGLGLGVAVLVAPALSLQAFTGPGVTVPLEIDLRTLGILVGGVIVTLLVGVVAASAVARRVSPARVLRAGEA
jgi:putative ABC transport system permease protein